MMLLKWVPFTTASYRQTMGRILSTPRACSDFISDAKNQPTTQPESHQKVCFFGRCCKWGRLTSARLRTVILKWRSKVTKWHQLLRKPKKANISRRHQWFSCEITSGDSLPADVLWGCDKRTPKDVCGEAIQGNERRNSKLMTYHYPDRGSASDWSCREGRRSTTQIWKVYVINMEIRSSFYHTSCISRGNQWRCREISAVSSSYPAHERALTCLLHFFQTCVFLENDFIGNQM